MEKNLIITSCNEKYGDFLINSWIKSLLENINKRNLDIVILDYGLSDNQLKDIKNKNIKIIKCKKDGHITLIRFRDIKEFLIKNRYNQVLSVDGGDIIFQSDISEIFLKNKDKFRVVREHLRDPFMKQMLIKNPVSKELKNEILNILNKKMSINGGVIIAPSKKFIQLCNFIIENAKNVSYFGTDQFLINLYLYKNGFVEMPQKFNFMPSITNEKFKISEGVFLDKNNEKIPIVHNNGYFFRAIKDFGIGKDKNKIKLFNYWILKFIRNINSKINPYK
jgi:hypothetical protein